MSRLQMAFKFTCALALSLAVSTSVVALQARAETTLYINGKIYTGAAAGGFAQAMAVTDEKIAAVGSNADVQKLQGNGVKVVDLHGATVVPGIIDSHVHTMFGSMSVHGLNLSTPEKTIWPDEQPEEFVKLIHDFAVANPKEKVLFARANFDSIKPPSHELLDRAVSDRPIIVHNPSEHYMWVNAKALAIAGITNKPNPDPILELGIMRNPDGSPIGVIREASMELIEQPIIAMLTEQEKLAILKQGIHFLNTMGITMVNNATGSLAEIELYGKLRDSKELTVRTRTAFGAIAYPHHLTPQFLKDIETARTKFHDDWVSSGVIKFFMDGASGPYPPIYTQEDFTKLVLELDKRGFKIMTHALGTAGAKTALNGYEAAEKQNGKADRRFRMEHADRIEKEDLPRLAQLGIIASMQPSFCCAPPNPQAVASGVIQDPWNTLQSSGVRLAFSSDWPCTSPPDPFLSLQELTTREEWEGRGYGAGQSGRKRNGKSNNPQERLTVQQGIDGYTKGGAYATFMEDKLGTLEVGKLADFAVLSQDIFTVPSTSLAATKVKATIVGGRTVYGNPS